MSCFAEEDSVWNWDDEGISDASSSAQLCTFRSRKQVFFFKEHWIIWYMTRVAELQGNFAGTCCNRGKLPVSNAAFARCKGNTWGQCGSMVAIVRFIWFKLKAAWISETVENFPVHIIAVARKTWILSSPASQQLRTTTPSWRRFLELHFISFHRIRTGLSSADKKNAWQVMLNDGLRQQESCPNFPVGMAEMEQLEANHDSQTTRRLVFLLLRLGVSRFRPWICLPFIRQPKMVAVWEGPKWFLACFHCRNLCLLHR